MKGKSKFISLFMAAAMLISSTAFFTFAAPVAASVVAEDVDYSIVNPYANVDWSSFRQYKANLHCHTIASDGSNDFSDMIEKHYALGYDFLAITDHGTVDYSWTDVNTVPVLSLISKFESMDLSLKPTGLTQERFEQITTGEGRDGRGMLRIPNGIENNPTSFNNAHVNSWFADYGNGILGGTSDYETVLKGVQEAGGLSVINHPGEYTGAKKEDDPALAYNSDYSYYITKFTTLLLKYDSCIGIDINSKGDGRTRNDRKLWDILLENCIPNGRNVFAIATSDSHGDNSLDSGWTIHCLENDTVEDFRASMESGAFFAGSHYIKNSKELALIGEAIGEDLGTQWTANSETECPAVSRIEVDDALDTITISASNSKLIRWIANGEQIATGASIDLDDYSDKIGSYVRAEIFGDGGIIYTQAFVLEYENSPEAERINFFYDFGNLLAFLRNSILKTLEENVPFFGSFWKLMTENQSRT